MSKPFKPIPERFHAWALNVLGAHAGRVPDGDLQSIILDVAELIHEVHNQAVADCANTAIAMRDTYRQQRIPIAQAAASEIVLALSEKIELGGRWQNAITLINPFSD